MPRYSPDRGGMFLAIAGFTIMMLISLTGITVILWLAARKLFLG